MTRRHQHLFVLLVYVIVTFLLYGNTVQAKFAGDFYDWINLVRSQGFQGLLNGFGSSSSLYVYHTLIFGMFKLFSLSHWPWFILFITLHIANAFLIFYVISQLSHRFKIKHATITSFTTGLLFLISPKQIEPVVWGAALHYLLCTFLILLLLFCLLRYEQTLKLRYHIAGLLLGLVAVYTNEIAQVLPFVMLVFYGFVLFPRTALSFKYFTIKWVLPQLLFGLSFFFVNFIRIGEWIGHYGADVHLNFNIATIVGHGLMYMADYLLFLKHLSYPIKDSFYQFFHIPWITYAGFVFGIGLMLVVFLRLSRLSSYWRLLLFALGSFILLIGPVLNLDYYYLLAGMNDLYGYVASGFIYWALVLVIFWILPRKWALGVMAVYLAIALGMTTQGTISWQKSGIVRNGLLESFEPFDDQNTIILNMPNSVQGAYGFRNRKTFPLSYKAAVNENYNNDIWEIASYNMVNLTDGVDVSQIDSNSLQVQFSHVGSWWWINGVGATDYATKHYQVDFDKWSIGYKLNFTDSLFKNRTILYQDGIKWREFKMSP